MRKEYNGLLHYKEIRATKEECEKAIGILGSTDFDNIYVEINRVMEMCQVERILLSKGFEDLFDLETVKKYKTICNKIKPFINRYFSAINDDNFIEICNDLWVLYYDDFLACLENYKAYKYISDDTFCRYVSESHPPLYQLLNHQKIVKHYDKPLASVMMNLTITAEIIVDKFLRKDTSKVYLPKSLLPSSFEQIFQKYIDSDNPNPNTLKLIYISQSSAVCPMSDKIRLNAKRKYDEFWAKHFENGNYISYGVSVSFGNVEDTVATLEKDNTLHVIYNKQWLDDNLDYPTVLNNFIYVFGMFDLYSRCTFVSTRAKRSVFEEILNTRGIKSFPKGNGFNVSQMLTSAQMHLYYDLLKHNGIELEKVFKWFFEVYLKEEFGVEGFSFEIPSHGTSYLEKIRMIASEMDGILKQFQMYINEGNIDRELFEMSSEHIVFSNIGSLIDNKYGYASNPQTFKALYLLFSDQSLLSYTQKTKDKYSTFYELLINETMNISDYDFGVNEIIWLTEENYLMKDESGYISINNDNVKILKDLYEHDVVCLSYYPKEHEKIKELSIENTLFTKPEQDYLNYMLNKSEFSDGYDLRNKYLHSTYPKDEDTHFKDYIEFLKIMVLIIVKINDEFCINDYMK